MTPDNASYSSGDTLRLLFYTAANRGYEYFVPIYALCALHANPDAAMEIGLEDPGAYREAHSRQLEILDQLFPDRFHLSQANFADRIPGVVRFVSVPERASEFQYVYIGDIDILIFDRDVATLHVNNMAEHAMSYSNVVRPGSTAEDGSARMSGLHFAPTEQQYPLPSLDDLDLSPRNTRQGADEVILHEIVRRQGRAIVTDATYRPIHGIHMSPHRAPFGIRRDGLNAAFDVQHVENRRQVKGWDGIEKRAYRSAFMSLLREDAYRALLPTFDARLRHLLLALEYIAADDFGAYVDLHSSLTRRNRGTLAVRVKRFLSDRLTS